MRDLVILIVMVAACRSGGGGSTTPRDDAPSCAAVMPKLTELSWWSLERGGADPELVAAQRTDAQAIEPALVQACVDDAWSAEFRRCLAHQPLDQIEGECGRMITEAQQQTVIRIRENAEVTAVGPSCASVAEKMTEDAWMQVRDQGGDSEVVAAAQAAEEAIAPELEQACLDDAWSTALRECLLTTPVGEADEACGALATQTQRDRVGELRARAAAE